MGVPAGGPSTINGIIYQMLWSLARAAKLHILALEKAGDHEFTAATLILEPRSGGDLSLRDHVTTVEQIKSRSDGGTWSLRDIVEHVLPDLYLAARQSTVGTQFNFVTDGRMGRWKQVHDFFSSLGKRSIAGQDLREVLDAMKEVAFQRSTVGATTSTESFWGDGPYSELRLVERIIEEVRKRREVAGEDPRETQQNVLTLLANLKFTWKQSAEKIKCEVDAILVAVVNLREQIPDVRRALAMSLAERATKGEVEIEGSKFFHDHGLDAVPLSNWAAIRSRTAQLLERDLRIRHYDSAIDVRAQAAESIETKWDDSRPIVAVTGETGYGKSWQLFALAARRQHAVALPLYVEARGQVDATLSVAGRLVSEDIWGQDHPLSLQRIADRRREFHPDQRWWLTLIIDNLQEPEEARQLTLQPWEDWGVQVVFGCHPHVLNVVLNTAKNRGTAITINEFSLEETQRYLELTLPAGWPKMPQDVTHMLRRPLLAHLFVDTIGIQSWKPTVEYELYAAYWNRIRQGASAQHLLDEARLKTLVHNFLDGAVYPWTDTKLLEVGLDDANFHRLDRAGWLVRTTAGTFEIPHDRLLNWAVAVVLVEEFQQKRINIGDLGEKLKRLSFGEERISGKYLGYIAMDAVWIIANDANLSGQLSSLIPMLEHHHVQTEDLYTKLLPTIGPSIVDSLFRLLNEREGMLFYKKKLIDGLCELGGEQIAIKTRDLLDSDNRRLQRYALLILEKQPIADCLEKLWAVHCNIVNDPVPWLEEHESKYTLKGQSFDAILSCCGLKPEWLAEVAVSADCDREPVYELAYLIANLEFTIGKRIWDSAKPDLVKKVPRDKQRSIARCMARFPSKADRPWLVERLNTHDDLLGLACLQALVRVDPEAAVKHLDEVFQQDLQLGRSWWLPELMARLPSGTDEKLYAMMQAGESPWSIALCYEGSEELVKPRTLDLLLDQLDHDIAACLEDTDKKPDLLYRYLSFVASMCTSEQVSSLLARKGQSLEKNLTRFVSNVGSRKHLSQDSLARGPALEILFKMGGSGFTAVVNSFLKSESEFGRHDGLKAVIKRPDESSLGACEVIVRSDNLWDGKTPIEQNDAAVVLAACGQWGPVIEHFEKRWPHVFTTLTDPMEDDGPLPAEVSKTIRQRIEESVGEPAAGLVDMLGFSGNADDLPLIRSLLGKAQHNSEVARACLLAIERLRDHSVESVSLLEQFLGVKTARLARIALTVNSSDPAYSALLKHYETEFDLSLAINLLNDSRTVEHAINVTKEHLKDSESLFWSNEIDELVRYVRDSNTLRQIFDDQALRDYVLAGAFADEGRSWIVGSKSGAIRAVAVFDSAKAIQAAKTAIETPEARDRERYPYLLVELMADESITYLMNLLAVESSKTVEAAVARAISALNIRDELHRRLWSNDTNEIIGACRAIGYNDQFVEYDERLREVLNTVSETTIDDVLNAIKRNRRIVESEKLLTQLMDSDAIDEKWILLDSILEVAEPGDQGRPLPAWALKIWQKLTPYMQQHALAQLKKIRKKLFEELEKRSEG